MSATGEAGRLLLRLFAGLSLAFAHGIGKLPPSQRFVEGVGRMGLRLSAAGVRFANGGREV
jgi:putative oxidoreductase